MQLYSIDIDSLYACTVPYCTTYVGSSDKFFSVFKPYAGIGRSDNPSRKNIYRGKSRAPPNVLPPNRFLDEMFRCCYITV